eukprot:tig00021339_g20397.t1
MLGEEGALDGSRTLRFPSVVILCADIVDFTPLSSLLDAADLVQILDEFVTELVGDPDAYYAVLGLEEPAGPSEAVRLVELAERPAASSPPSTPSRRGRGPAAPAPRSPPSEPASEWRWALRRGASSEPAFDLFGPAIERAAALEKDGLPSRIHVSPEVRDAIAGEYETEPRAAAEGPHAHAYPAEEPATPASLAGSIRRLPTLRSSSFTAGHGHGPGGTAGSPVDFGGTGGAGAAGTGTPEPFSGDVDAPSSSYLVVRRA